MNRELRKEYKDKGKIENKVVVEMRIDGKHISGEPGNAQRWEAHEWASIGNFTPEQGQQLYAAFLLIEHGCAMPTLEEANHRIEAIKAAAGEGEV